MAKTPFLAKDGIETPHDIYVGGNVDLSTVGKGVLGTYLNTNKVLLISTDANNTVVGQHINMGSIDLRTPTLLHSPNSTDSFKVYTEGYRPNIQDLTLSSNSTLDADKIWSKTFNNDLLNAPVANSTVVNLSNHANYGIQLASENGSSDNSLFFRSRSDNPLAPNGNGLQRWKKIYHTGFKPTPADISAVSVADYSRDTRTFTSKIEKNRWGRIFKSAASTNTLSGSFSVTISYTRNNVVCSASFDITHGHKDTAQIITTSSHNFSTLKLRVTQLALASNDIFVEVFDTNIQAEQNFLNHTIYVRVDNVRSSITPYPEFESGDLPFNILAETTTDGVSLKVNNNKIWHEGNDGVGSGLDADKLAGASASTFVRKDQSSVITGDMIANSLSSINGEFTGITSSKIITNISGDVVLKSGISNAQIGITTSGSKPQWSADGIVFFDLLHKGSMGAASNIDADLLDGKHGSDYGRLTSAQTWTSTNTVTGALIVHGPDLVLKATASDPGDLLFTDSTGAQLGRVWSAANTLMLSSTAANTSGADGTLKITPTDLTFSSKKVYHEGFKPTAADTGAVAKTGDTMSGKLAINNLLRVQRLTLRDNSIELHEDDTDDGSVSINYYGYQSNTTKFRDFTVYDGKSVKVLTVDGSEKTITMKAAITADKISIGNEGAIDGDITPRVNMQGLIPGSSNSLLYRGSKGSHIVQQIRADDVQDSFAVVVNSSFSNPAVIDTPDSIAFQVKQNKEIQTFGNNIFHEGFRDVAMTEVQFNANRATRKERYKASGFINSGRHHISPNDGVVNQGLSTWDSAADLTVANMFAIGKTTPTMANLGSTSKTDHAEINVNGIMFKISGILGTVHHDYNHCLIKIPPAPNGLDTFDSATGIKKRHATAALAFASQTLTNKVVINRVDLWGFEIFAEEVTATNPLVYAYGMIQSTLATMNDITTVESLRAITYYAMYDGDITSRGKGVNFLTATNTQKRKILADPLNNLYYTSDNRLIQMRCRARTIAGAGNGDWQDVNSNSGNTSTNVLGFFTNETHSRITPQGISDVATVLVDPFFAATKFVANNKFSDTGVYAMSDTYHDPLTKSANSECYFLVGGTVNRLNQGAYHPSFNPNGTRRWNTTIGEWSNYTWDNAMVSNSSIESAFNVLGGNPSVGENKGAYVASGYIGSTHGSGRPDKRLYDAIYTSGAGGIQRDLRYSAKAVTDVDFAAADTKAKNGTLRGREKQVFTKFHQNAYSLAFYASNPTRSSIITGVGGTTADFFTNGLMANTPVMIYAPTLNKIVYGRISGVNGHIVCGYYPENRYSGTHVPNILPQNTPIYLLEYRDLPSSVSGKYMYTDVIGNPTNIVDTTALKDGWQGSWVPHIPDAVTLPPIASRKISTFYQKPVTNNNGATWVIGTNNTNLLTNMFGDGPVPLNDIIMYQYTTTAKITEPTTNSVIYGGKYGIGDVFVGGWQHPLYSGSLFESLLGKVPTANIGDVFRTYPLESYALSSSGSFYPAELNYPRHPTISLTPPDSLGSLGFKALNYNVSDSGMGYVNYAANELKYQLITFISVDRKANLNLVKGAYYKISPPKAGLSTVDATYTLVKCIENISSIVFDSLSISPSGNYYDTNNNIISQIQPYNGWSDGWGDDSKIHITDNESTFVNLNGGTVKAVTHRLVEPLGWTD